MSKNKKLTYFQDKWLDKSSEFHLWLCKATENTEAKCRLCKSTFSLSNMGVRALKCHAETKSHQKLVQDQLKISTFFEKRRNVSKESSEKTDSFSNKTVDACSSSSEEVVIVKPSSSQSTIPISFQDGGKLNAEIRWVLKHVVSGYSDNSVTDSIDLFKVMFPDSKIAPLMELGKDKLKYLANYGIAPYFQEILKEEVSTSEWFSISYDESLNKSVQESEMDLVLRYWDDMIEKVQVRYWDSMFLGHTKAVDLLKSINDGLTGLDLSRQIQLSMDGPNVNWKVLSEMKKEREEAGLSKLVDIGSCNLHIVHGALQTATEETGWKLKAVLKGSFQLFKDSPARRDDFISVTGSTTFTLL